MDKCGDEIKDSAKVADDSRGKLENLGTVMKWIAVGIGVAIAAIGTASIIAGKKLFDMENTAAVSDKVDKSSQRLGL